MMFIPAKKKIIERVQPAKIPRWCLCQPLVADSENDLLKIPSNVSVSLIHCGETPYLFRANIIIFAEWTHKHLQCPINLSNKSIETVSLTLFIYWCWLWAGYVFVTIDFFKRNLLFFTGKLCSNSNLVCVKYASFSHSRVNSLSVIAVQDVKVLVKVKSNLGISFYLY